MPAKRRDVRNPPSLDEAVEIRRKRLGWSYSRYVRSLERYDIICGGDHWLTGDIDDLPDSERDRIDVGILAAAKDGKRERGVLLERIVERALEREDGTVDQGRKNEILKRLKGEL